MVVDRRGERLGKVRQVYRDGTRLGWVAVRGNVVGTQETLVPLDGAELEDDVLSVPVNRSKVLSAPRRPADQPLEDEERDAVLAFYAEPAAELPARTTRTDTTPKTGPVPTRRSTAAAAADPVEEPDRVDEPAAEAGEVTMTAFRERMRVSTERVPMTRVRLTKTVVVERQTATVTVRREEVRLVREPIVEGDVVPGATVGTAEQEVVLHEERVVVATEVVPVERVRLVVEDVVEDREVDAEVRSERIDLSQERNAAT